jgi:two-component system, NtrC family, sensor kinase
MKLHGGEGQARLVEERRRAYLLLALMLTGCWPLDVVMLGRWPLDTLAIRVAWSALCLVAASRNRRAPERADATLSIVAVASCFAMSGLALSTGGTESPLFYMLPFLPVLAAQLEPATQSTLRWCVGLILGAGLAMLIHEDKSLVSLLAWSAITFFMGWWAVYWLERSRERRAALIETERRQSVLERDRSRVLQELALAEQRRGSMERLAAVGQLAAGVAHEVNNPLASVKSNLEYLLSVDPQAPDRELVLRESLLGLERIHSIVEDLRSFSREPGQSADDVDAHAAIEEACRIASIRLRVLAAVETRVAPGVPQLRCHRGRLVQVLVNLLVNAADAIESAGRTVDGKVLVRAFAEGDAVHLHVEDNGRGVDPALAERIFEPFVTTKPAGSGIGLALAREFTESLGGVLRVDRSDLGGARFSLELPLASAASRSA